MSETTAPTMFNMCPICWKPYYDDHQGTIIPDLCEGHEPKFEYKYDNQSKELEEVHE